jgi:hypothetical protein
MSWLAVQDADGEEVDVLEFVQDNPTTNTRQVYLS